MHGQRCRLDSPSNSGWPGDHAVKGPGYWISIIICHVVPRYSYKSAPTPCCIASLTGSVPTAGQCQPACIGDLVDGRWVRARLCGGLRFTVSTRAHSNEPARVDRGTGVGG